MIDEPTRELLQECVRRESRSLLQYVLEVPVWAGPADRIAHDKLKALALAERRATDDLGRYLQKKKIGVPSLGPYPSSFTTLNDAALNHLLPRLVREQREALAALEADLQRVTDPDVRGYLEQMVQLKRQHQPELESLSAKPHSFTKVPG